MIKILKTIWTPFHFLLKIFSNDPAASCSRMIAMGVIIYVGYMGIKHWEGMTQIQSTFLLGYLSGLLPYVTGKLFEGVKQLPDIINSFKANDHDDSNPKV